MKPIERLQDLTAFAVKLGKKRLAVAFAEDPHTIGAIDAAVEAGLIEADMIGSATNIRKVAVEAGIDPAKFNIIDIPNDVGATTEAVRRVKTGEADILMKGLVATDKYLKAILDKENGLLPANRILSHVTVVDTPAYRKLLFLTDVAVIPFPTLEQKMQMLQYAVDTAKAFGITRPKVALLSATEKANPKYQSSIDYALMCKVVERSGSPDCIIDGPLDLFLACDPDSVDIKGVPTPVAGDADVLIFPDIEAANIFYKGVMLFGNGELAGLLQGTIKPVTVTSRSESVMSKYYSIAAACVVGNEGETT